MGPMDAGKNEKSFDNRRAALGSRILGSRDWRLETGKDALAQERSPTHSKNANVSPCHSHTDVTECHKCDIAWFIHKLICRNGLDFKLQPNGLRFPTFNGRSDFYLHWLVPI